MHIEKNVLEAILNTLLMNGKSKETVKARQDLQRLGIRSGLWLGQTKNGKCLKPQAAYSFAPKSRKKFYKIAKPIIELCSLFKQICSATLMEDDMLKAQIKVVNILCDLELIYPPALFDIMIHLVIHLPLEALEGGPIRPRLFPNKDMKEEFPDRFGSQIRQRHVNNDKDPEGSTTSELFTLACGPTWTPISINSCVVDGVRYVVHSRDEHGQSTEVDAPPDIIDVVDEDDDITDDEDALPYDLADSDNEDLINDDDDGVDKVYSSEEED
nr:hypothetical protein [Tanacetum cinerariifolium]